MKANQVWVWVLGVTLMACGQPSAAPVLVDAAPIQDDAEQTPALFRPFHVLKNPPKATPDTRSAEQIATAACTTPTGEWRCAAKRPKVFAASGSTPIIPASWTVPNWFVNKSTGNDANACTSSGSPCATKQEILVHRWGCQGTPAVCPRFRQSTILEQDASDTDNTDPIYANVGLESGASFVVQGGPPTVVSTVSLAGKVAKNRAAGTNSLLQFNLGASGAIGELLINSTHPSRAWVYRSLGANAFSVSQPMVAIPAMPPTSLAQLDPSEVDTWANTDSVTLNTPVAINVVSLTGTVSDYNAAFTSAVYFYNAIPFDPTAGNGDAINVGNNTALVEVGGAAGGSNMRTAVFFGEDSGVSRYVTNCGLSGVNIEVASVQEPSFVGGYAGMNNNMSGQPTFDGDFIFASGFSPEFVSGIYMGFVYLDTSVTIDSSFASAANISGYGGPVIYGSGANTINMRGSSHFARQGGASFVAVFTAPGLVTGIKLNGTATGSAHTGATPDVLDSARVTSPANLDGTVAGGGFAGNAFNLGGASVANF